MKSWFKKVINKLDYNQYSPQHSSQQQYQRKSVIVSFDKHEQKKQFIHIAQKFINKENINFKRQNQQTDDKNQVNNNLSVPRRNVKDQYNSQSEIQQFCDSRNQRRYRFYHKRNQNNQFCQESKNLINKKIEKEQANAQSQQCSSQDISSNSSVNQTLQMSEQIINNLINMYSLIKMIKSIPELRGQYITLKYLNKLLRTSFQKESELPQKQLIRYIMSKSAQGPEDYLKKVKEEQSRTRGLANKLIGPCNKQKETLKQLKKQKRMRKFYYKNFSNGLIYQYYPVRALIWKIVSGYLPNSKQKWIWKMQVSLLKYRELVKQHIIQTSMKKLKTSSKQAQNFENAQRNRNKRQSFQASSKQKCSEDIRKKSQTLDPLKRLNKLEQKRKDHPLNLNGNSKWKTYFQDFELWNIIERDTSRTRQNYPFFRQANTFALVNEDPFAENDLVKIQLQNGQKISYRLNNLHLSRHKKQCTTYVDALTRIIFIYLKVHPQQKYYQGLNELVAIIYFSFTNKNSQYFRRVSQSDTYQIFSLLMEQLRISPLPNPENKKLPQFNHFISGEKYFDLLKNMMKKCDFRLYQYLEINNGFQYMKAISIRWFMTIFLTEFSLDDALILWDCVMVLIGNKQLVDNLKIKKNQFRGIKLTQFILYMALAVIHLNRNKIIQESQQGLNKSPNNCSNILSVFQKINQKPQEIVSKSINLYKSYPNLLQ